MVQVVRDGVFRARLLMRLHISRHGLVAQSITDSEGYLMVDDIVVRTPPQSVINTTHSALMRVNSKIGERGPLGWGVVCARYDLAWK
jgi:hypothetical protein